MLLERVIRKICKRLLFRLHELPRKHEHYIDLSIEDLRGDDRNVQRKLVFYLCRSIFVARVDIEDIAINFVKPNRSEELIEPISTDNQRHPRCYRLILYLSHDHLRPPISAPASTAKT